MKKTFIPFLAFASSITIASIQSANSQSWNLAGNGDATNTSILGSTVNVPLSLYTNARPRLTIGNSGNFNFNGSQLTLSKATGDVRIGTGNLLFGTAAKTIQFATPIATSAPMITMFPSGTQNFDRMVIAHSLSYPNSGLQYQDDFDKFNFLSGGTPVLTADLGGEKVGIGTSNPTLAKLEVDGVVGNTVALFRGPGLGTSKGLSLVTDWPGIYFNSYYNGGHKTMSPGYAGILNFDPSAGNLYLGTSATAAGSAGDPTSTPPALLINKNGNVGIGATTPGYLLDVAGRMRLRSGSGSAGTWLMNGANTADAAFMGMANDNSIGFYGSGGGWGLIMNTVNSNVGIGTFTPGYKLQVVSTGSNRAIDAISPSGPGVYGTGFYGVYGYTSLANGDAIHGQAYGSGAYGVTGRSDISIGTYGSSANYIGVYGYTANNASYAGYFAGNVFSTGNYQGSDRSLKQNIADLSSAMDIIGKLQPKSYTFRQDGNYKLMNLPVGKHYGLIAQDVEQVLPNLVKVSSFETSASGKQQDSNSLSKPDVIKPSQTIEFKALNYTELIPIVIRGMQELEATIQKQDAKIEALTALLNKLSPGNSTSLSLSNNTSLSQSVPNPNRNNTSIDYKIPANAANAQLIISDMVGNKIQQIRLNNDHGVVKVDTSKLSQGTYTYTLFVDGKLIGTKKMEVLK